MDTLLIHSVKSTLSHIILLFDQIESDNYQLKVCFYRDNFSSILSLEEKDQNFFKYEYVCSLFELGKYSDLLAVIDDLIEYVFIENIAFSAEDTFVNLIFIKSASLYNLEFYDDAIAIIKQVLGIDTQKPEHMELLFLCLMKKKRRRYMTKRIHFITAILFSAFLFASLWFLHPHPMWVQTIRIVVGVIIGAVLILYFGTWVVIYFLAKRNVFLIIDQIRKERAKRQNNIQMN